jgi:hypothetical protein
MMNRPLVDLTDIARTVPIEVEAGRRGIRLKVRIDRAGPCPRCGGHDRFSINLKKQVWNCRGCQRGGDVIELVRFLDDVDFRQAVALLAGDDAEPRRRCAALPPPPAKCNAGAAWLWGCRERVSDCNAAGRYLRKRGYGGTFPTTLRFLPANGKHPPALIGAFGFCDEPKPDILRPPGTINAVHITRLTEAGDKAALEPVKIMLGSMSGLPIVLAPVNEGLGLAITEGIEDGLSVLETGLGVWAAGSAGNMPKIAAALPPYVECVTIFAHRDDAGMRFAKEAAQLIATKAEIHVKGRG